MFEDFGDVKLISGFQLPLSLLHLYKMGPYQLPIYFRSFIGAPFHSVYNDQQGPIFLEILSIYTYKRCFVIDILGGGSSHPNCSDGMIMGI